MNTVDEGILTKKHKYCPGKLVKQGHSVNGTTQNITCAGGCGFRYAVGEVEG